MNSKSLLTKEANDTFVAENVITDIGSLLCRPKNKTPMATDIRRKKENVGAKPEKSLTTTYETRRLRDNRVSVAEVKKRKHITMIMINLLKCDGSALSAIGNGIKSTITLNC